MSTSQENGAVAIVFLNPIQELFIAQVASNTPSEILSILKYHFKYYFKLLKVYHFILNRPKLLRFLFPEVSAIFPFGNNWNAF